MKFKSLLVLLFFTLSLVTWADEGMWLPSKISERIEDMQAKGLKLSSEDIYSINQASLKDAVMLFGRGCTGELISNQGLLITNHHCGYGQIQKHSSIEHDYLRDGFWAMSLQEELPNPELSVSFLDEMMDVTSVILKGVKDAMPEEKRMAIVQKNTEKLIKKLTNAKKFKYAQIKPLFNGNQYFAYVFTEYKDVRLVGAPPSAVGKFGGDTDNWAWPRHTGDFSIFRIYVDENNEPAEYSENNVPYTPKKYFPISTKGVNEGDFTFIYGCPGSTKEYITSDAVRYISEISNPVKVGLRTMILDVQRKYMASDQAVRIQYSSKNARVANAWKKWQGEILGVNRNNIVSKKLAYEEGFRKWSEGSEYMGVLDSLKKYELALEPYALALDYYNEAVRAVEISNFASIFTNLINSSTPKDIIIKLSENFYKDYYLPIDKEIFISLMTEYVNYLDESTMPKYISEQLAKYYNINEWAEELFNNSVFTNKEKMFSMISSSSSVENLKEDLKNDPASVFSSELSKHYSSFVMPNVVSIRKNIALLYRTYMKGMMSYESNRAFYPDANLTLRVAYGHVTGYSPKDGVDYLPVSTIEGIMQKDNPDIFDYNIPQKLRDIYATKDYGRWEVNGTVPVCFLANNHTTGGNSGSPIINANGELVGVNFDRVWEGTMSDLAFDSEYCRNISLDIRYVLFYIDRMAGASRLIEEMELR